MPVRVLFLLDELNVVGGTERQLRELIVNLDRSRVDPVAMTLYDQDMPHRAEFGGLGCPTSSVSLRRLRDPFTVRALLRLASEIRRQQIDIVHTFFPDSGIFGTIAAKLSGAKAVIGRRDLGFWHTPQYLLVLRMLQRLADAYIVNSQAVRRTVIEAEGVAPDRIHVVYNGFFDTPNGAPRPAPVDLGFPQGARIVGTVANLRPVKRLDRFIDLAAGIRDERARFVIVGHGEQLEALLQQARSAGLADRLRIVHAISGVADLIQSFRVGVLTSESEGLSNTLVEYGRASVPAVAFDVGGNAEVVDDGGSGYLCRPYDVAEMTRRVDGILHDDALRTRLGDRARSLCRERFAGERMVEETTAIYVRLAGR